MVKINAPVAICLFGMGALMLGLVVDWDEEKKMLFI
jgi:hypothetical protein